MTAPTTTDHRHTVDEELRDSLAIHYAFEALSDVDSETTVLEHCERLSMLMFDTAQVDEIEHRFAALEPHLRA